MCINRDKSLGALLGACVLFLSLFSSLFDHSVSAASFDCGKAQSKLERGICADPKLSALDDELAGVYRKALGLVSHPAELKKAQQIWLKKVRGASSNPGDIEAAYLARIEEIRLDSGLGRPMFAAAPPPSSIFGRYSQTEPNCTYPKEGEDEYDCSDGELESYIDIRAGGGNEATVTGELWFFNGFACGPFEGKAEWVNGVLRMPKLEGEGNRCVLILRFKDGRVFTEDPGSFCKEGLGCGANAGFQNIELPKLTAKGGGAGGGKQEER